MNDTIDIFDCYFYLHKGIVKKIGIEPALIYNALQVGYYNATNESDWFSISTKEIQKFTGMTYAKQKKSINKLIEHKIIEQFVIYFPYKRYFKINFENVPKF